MSGFSPCVPFTPFAGVGGRGGPRVDFSEDATRDLVEGVSSSSSGGRAEAVEAAMTNTGPQASYQAGAFRGFKNTYDNNPIGCLQERMQKQGISPVYALLNTRGYDHHRLYTMQVTLPNSVQAVGTGATKKLAKHNAARGMLDVLDGRAAAVTDKVSQSITDGLKALRGDGDSKDKERDSGRSSDRDRGRDSRDTESESGDKYGGAKPWLDRPKYGQSQAESDYAENQKKHQEEILKQSLEYGPLGVKLWFTGDSKEVGTTSSASSGAQEPNRAPPDNSFQPIENADERLECVAKGQFFIKGPVHNETFEDYIQDLVFDTAWLEILKRSGQQSEENVCKLCNLVFVSKKCYDEHKYTDDHLHVCKGYFPGKGGYHCFLCWISFNQPEGLLNHVARENHQRRAKRKGVKKIWMEPVSSNSWDLINVHKHLEDCRREDESKSWKTRDEARRAKEKGRRSRSRDRQKRRRSKSPDKWSHDMYEEPGSSSSRRRLASDYYKWREVKEEKRRSEESSRSHNREDRDPARGHREDSRHSREDSRHSREDSRHSRVPREDSSHSRREDRSHSDSREERDRGYRDPGVVNYNYIESRSREDDRRQDPSRADDRYQDSYRDEDRHREERDRGYRDLHHSRQESVASVGGDLREMLRKRRGDTSGESDAKKKKSKRKKGSKKDSDHEEVNEVQSDFEIDSVGQIENGEETLQKMKSAIIGILDDEIFALNTKNNK